MANIQAFLFITNFFHYKKHKYKRYFQPLKRRTSLLSRFFDIVNINYRKLTSKKLEKALSAMQSAADTEENLMPYIVTAAKAFATTGEISNTFRDVFGEYRFV